MPESIYVIYDIYSFTYTKLLQNLWSKTNLIMVSNIFDEFLNLACKWIFENFIGLSSSDKLVGFLLLFIVSLFIFVTLA